MIKMFISGKKYEIWNIGNFEYAESKTWGSGKKFSSKSAFRWKYIGKPMLEIRGDRKCNAIFVLK